MPIRISGSTGISGLDGSATTPVLQGASANSGIYYSGNTVFVSTSGTNALTIGPTGNVAFANSSVSIGGQTISAYSGMMKNRIINGDFRIDQRFAGTANNNIALNQYVVDRWRYNAIAAAKLRYQQNNTNGPGSSATQIATGFPNYFGANVVSSNTVNAGDYWFFAQDVEGLNVSDLGWGTANAAPVTISFWSYSSIAGSHGGSLRNGSGNRSYPFSYSISAANTWQYQTITIPGDTTGTWFSNNNTGVTVFFGIGLGSNYTSTANGIWQTGNYYNATGSVNIIGAANGAFYLTGVQLEKGSQATPFEFRHYTTELQLCQRYFSSSSASFVLPIVRTSDARRQGTYFFKENMRISPTILTFTLSLDGASGSGTVTETGVDSFSIDINPSSSAGSVIKCSSFTASAELAVLN